MLINETIKVLEEAMEEFKNNFGMVKAFLAMTSNLETIKERSNIYIYIKRNHGA